MVVAGDEVANNESPLHLVRTSAAASSLLLAGLSGKFTNKLDTNPLTVVDSIVILFDLYTIFHERWRL